MNITHHPSDATLAGFASRSFNEGMSLLVATHLSLCPWCRRAVHAFEHVGGALLDTVEPVPLHADALQRAITRIQQGNSKGLATQTPRKFEMSDLPAPLSQYALGPWRWVGRGLHWRSVNVPSEPGSRVFMLKALSGTGVPYHRHAGTEWTCVLEGAFRHDLGRYGPGDFDEADETDEHTPLAEGPCVCLIALQGDLKFEGWLARLGQRLGRFWSE